MNIASENVKFFTNFSALEMYLLSNLDTIKITKKKYGLDTEWERDSKELTILSLSFSNLPIIVISLFCIKKLPGVLIDILSRDDLIACARSIGTDCSYLYSQYGILIKNRIEIGNLATIEDPSFKKTKEGTSVASLTEKHLKMRLPIEKSVGQNASYATKNLSKDLKLYAACDSLCHRLLTEEIERKIHNRDPTTNLTENSVLKVGSSVYIMNRGKAVLEGTVTFHGIFGAMKKIGNITLGKNHVMVKVEKKNK